MKYPILPPYLQPGDTIGIVCPSGYMPADKAETCVQTLQQWGYQVKKGTTLGHQHHYFSGTDEERLADLQAMLNDTTLKAILCGRGGYGLSRIIDQIDWQPFLEHPKWIIGFSDITVLHAQLASMQVASLHSPMVSAFNDLGADSIYIQYLKAALMGKASRYVCSPHSYNVPGTATGVLVGGNLTILAHLVGSPTALQTDGCILYIEDVGEYLYNIDRMLIQLQRSGAFNNLAGLIIGGFSEMKDTQIPFGQTIEQIIAHRFAGARFPICFGFPVSHTDHNVPLKSGALHTLNVTAEHGLLTEIV